ncbi:DHH family phosphoesterase [Alcanivorax sp. JB21]|uniref:DHH family phosphoesterase n=1 Tax=Alcanivorax limicola TaxID=2874102 RepID=UPI001CBAB1E2|nr:DHH family phosphoesterase [Alcanivorax limicola]MBZ2188128.1 DHH family phosphoesterase [Alcanivorax limicola]
MHFDIFNGDADGLCALVQLRLAEPKDSTLITGVKRDLALVQQVPLREASGVTVLDVNFASNRDAVQALLAQDVPVFYVDHHNPGGDLPVHPQFQAIIETEATVCTSLLVDRHLGGRYPGWAVAAAFGDNMRAVALARGQQAGFSEAYSAQLESLGVCLNYNGYGASVEDLHFHPADLYRRLVAFESPSAFMTEDRDTWEHLAEGYQQDMTRGREAAPYYQDERVSVICLPNAAWARRVSGVLGNELANAAPGRAHAVVTHTPGGDLAVSIRAPLEKPEGADVLAKRFPTGGGRKGAAGVNVLPVAQLDAFVAAMREVWGF